MASLLTPSQAEELKEAARLATSSELQQKLFPAKVVFIFFTIVFLVGIIYFLIKSSYLKVQFWYDVVEFFSWRPYGVLNLQRRWKKIMSRLEEGDESKYKLAVVEADDFLNEVLKKKGYKGETTEERLKKVSTEYLPNKNKILKTRQARNSVMYNPDFDLPLEKAQNILEVYQATLRNLGMI